MVKIKLRAANRLRARRQLGLVTTGRCLGPVDGCRRDSTAHFVDSEWHERVFGAGGHYRTNIDVGVDLVIDVATNVMFSPQ